MAMALRRGEASLALAGMLIVFGVLLSCSSKQKPHPAEQASGQRIPDQESWNSTLITTDMGHVTAKIWFGHMRKFNDEDVYEFDQKIRVEIYDKHGKRTSWITADRGRLFEAKKFMEAMGHVVAHSDSANVTLYTERLQWDDQRKKIISNEFVTLATEQDTLYGVGFESDADLTRWYIRSPRGYSERPVELELERKTAKDTANVQKTQKDERVPKRR